MEGRFVTVKVCKLEERKFLWRTWKDVYDLKSSKIEVFEPSPFLEERLNERRQGEFSAKA
jgi:hypothetical protein